MPFLLCAVISLCLCFTPSKGEWHENKGLWYYISQDKSLVSYQQATQQCQSMNARLAVITNTDQNDFIKKQSSDGIQRWIGLSNNKHGYTHTNCKRYSLVWNYDFDCYIKFKMFAHGSSISESASCMAVVLKDGIWSLKSCTDVYGFICQWECKKMSLQFDNLKLYSGIYTFSHYWDSSIVYRKQDTDDVIDLLKNGDTDWMITIQQRKYSPIAAFHRSRLYVPYGESTNWKTPEGKSMPYNFFCIECNKLSVCGNAESKDGRCYSQLTLEFDDNSNPEYVDETADVIINDYYNSYYCICVHNDCGDRCGYIFPYPKQTTTTTLNDGSKVDITNLCLPEDETISAKPDEDVTTANMSDKSNNYATTVTVSVVVFVIIIIVAIAVTCVVIPRRKFSESGNSGTHTNDNISNNDRFQDEVTTNDNMYVDINESRVDNQSSDTYNEGQYSYADMAIPTSITPKVNISTKNAMIKVSYGVHNDDVPHPVRDYKDGIDELYAKVNKPKIPSARLKEGINKTKILPKKLIKVQSDIETEKVQRTDDDPQLSDNDPAIHYNSDDDLELFENSVYESTQQ